MQIIEPEVRILTPLEPELLINIEKAGRTCYKSEDSSEFTAESAAKFVRMLIKRGHEAMIEHGYVGVKFTGDTGFSHEAVRHRVGSFAQESTRYCNYSKNKFGSQITFIQPFAFETCDGYHDAMDCTCADCWNYWDWRSSCEEAEYRYLSMIGRGIKPEWARSVLPKSLKTELVCTFNLREWRHFFRMRAEKHAHPQMRQLSLPLFYEFYHKVPALVEDLLPQVEEALEGIPFAEVVYDLTPGKIVTYDAILVPHEEPEPFHPEWTVERED